VKQEGKQKSSSKTHKAAVKGSKRKVKGRSKGGPIFPVGRVGRFLKKGKYGERVGRGAALFMAGVLEYLTAEILELAGSFAIDSHRKRIIPRHIELAIRSDDEFNFLLRKTTIPSAGVLPSIPSQLLPKQTRPKIKKSKS
jgi:histone H2A